MATLKQLLTPEENAAISKFLNTNEYVKSLTINDLSNICYFIVDPIKINEAFKMIKPYRATTAGAAMAELGCRAEKKGIKIFL